MLPTNSWNNKRWLSFHSTSSFHLATNSTVWTIETGGEPPKEIAVMVKPITPVVAQSTLSMRAATNADQMWAAARAQMDAFKAETAQQQIDWTQAKWMPFNSTVSIDLGPGEGKRFVSIGARWTSSRVEYSSGTSVWVDYTPSHITITRPAEPLTSQPLIQLVGYSDEELLGIRYDLVNASNHVFDVLGYINHKEDDPVRPDKTITYFSCYDLGLALGTNLIELRCTDLAGNVATNKLTYVFDLEHDKTPPVIALEWPTNGSRIVGETFNARGRLDDPTAQLSALVCANGHTNTVSGMVGREGYFGIEAIPVQLGVNLLTLIATDAAGNSSRTNFTVYRGEGVLVMDEITPEQTVKSHITATGRVLPSNQRVFINGVEAKVRADGTWLADKVPVISPPGGGVLFHMTALPSGPSPGIVATNHLASSTKPHEMISVSAGLSTNGMTLNVGQPACGTFNLHLSDTAGRSFILEASTNLVDWTPILTNLNSGPAFEFTDTNSANYRCRFFRVLPVP